MTKYSDYPVKFFDVSQYNDNPDTVYFPTLDKLIAAGYKGIAVRVSYAQVTDKAFAKFWAEAKGKLPRIPYVWMHMAPSTGISDDEWGRIQARYAYSLLKNDIGEFVMYLDIENGGGVKITILNQSKIGRIKFGFLDEWKKLSNQNAGIYTNQGYMFVMGVADKTRDLWLSWYNRSVTIETINAMLLKSKWTGKLRFWQYTSDGDINDDGKSEAKALGMESASLDLNVFIGTEDEWNKLSGNVIPIPTPIPVPTPPVPEPIPFPSPVVSYSTYKVTVPVRNVRIGAGSDFTVVPSMEKHNGDLVKIDSTKIGTDKLIWGHIFGTPDWIYMGNMLLV